MSEDVLFISKSHAIKKILPIADIEAIDKEFVNSGMVRIGHDGSKGPTWYDFQDKEEFRHIAAKITGVKKEPLQRRFFTKVYEVYTDGEAKRLLLKKDEINLFSLHETFVRLTFDYRNNTGVIKLERKELSALLKHFPSMKVIEPTKDGKDGK